CLGEDAERIVANYNHLMLGGNVRFPWCLVERSQKFLSRSIQVAALAEHHATAEVKTRHRAVSFGAETALEKIPGECTQIVLKSLFNRSAVLSSLPFQQKRLQTRIRRPHVVGETLRFALRQRRCAELLRRVEVAHRKEI